MTHEQAEKIIKEALQKTRHLIPEFYPEYSEVIRVDLSTKDLFRVVFHEEKVVIRDQECTRVKSTVLHWRKYFLSHEFCKEWFGEKEVHAQTESGYFLYDGHKNPIFMPANKYHQQQLVLCNNLIEVAEYIMENPKNEN